MKKIFSIFVIGILLLLVGCTSKANENKLEQYITNYNEVTTIICKELSAEEVKISQSDNKTSDINTLEAFGNGNYWITANNIDFCVYCENRIAIMIEYNNGNTFKVVRTPTYEEIREKEINEQISLQENSLKDKDVDPSLIHIPESQ